MLILILFTPTKAVVVDMGLSCDSRLPSIELVASGVSKVTATSADRTGAWDVSPEASATVGDGVGEDTVDDIVRVAVFSSVKKKYPKSDTETCLIYFFVTTALNRDFFLRNEYNAHVFETIIFFVIISGFLFDFYIEQ